MPEQTSRLENAVAMVIEKGTAVTPDLGGNAGTINMADAIAAQLSIL